MFNRFSLALAVVMIGMASATIPASAGVITDLFNTGVDAFGVALPGGDGVTDPHYTVASSTIGAVVGSNAVTYKHPLYFPNSATSRWVSNSSDGSPGNGIVTFQTTFDLTGFDPASASISGLWGVDNVGEIFLNGSDTGIGLLFGFPAFESLHAFAINSGFISGINTLAFEITDEGPPLAFRVEGIVGTADAAAVPEPSTIALLAAALLSLLGLGAMRRRAGG